MPAGKPAAALITVSCFSSKLRDQAEQPGPLYQLRRAAGRQNLVARSCDCLPVGIYSTAIFCCNTRLAGSQIA